MHDLGHKRKRIKKVWKWPRQVIKDNLRNKYHNNSKSSYFVIKEIGDGANGDNGVVSENMVLHIYPRMICMYVCMYVCMMIASKSRLICMCTVRHCGYGIVSISVAGQGQVSST